MFTGEISIVFSIYIEVSGGSVEDVVGIRIMVELVFGAIPHRMTRGYLMTMGAAVLGAEPFDVFGTATLETCVETGGASIGRS